MTPSGPGRQAGDAGPVDDPGGPVDGPVPVDDPIGRALAGIWALVPGEDAPGAHTVVPATRPVSSAFEVTTAAVAPIVAAALAATSLGRHRGLVAPPPVVRADHAVAACACWVAVDGVTPPAWAPLSGLYRTGDDRFVQIHANFPHHAAGVADLLGVPAEREAVAAAIATRSGAALEAELIETGLVGALYRTLGEWAIHPHAAATDALPLLAATRIDDAPPVPLPPARVDGRPLVGLRVLDCSRVLAGPVCGMTLAANGADVLRVGAAHLPSVELAVIATGFGKRNTFLDLRSSGDAARFAGLVADADVVIDAYRPGALDGLGFGPDRLAALRPGIVVVRISAFDRVGPWAGRRGFDSIVQTTTGIALAGAVASGRAEPVHLPFQALDFAAGHLAAFAATRMVGHRATVGGSWLVEASLLGTRNWLVGLGGPHPFEPGPGPDPTPWVTTSASPFGSVDAVGPVIGSFDRPPDRLGSAEPVWLPSG